MTVPAPRHHGSALKAQNVCLTATKPVAPQSAGESSGGGPLAAQVDWRSVEERSRESAEDWTLVRSGCALAGLSRRDLNLPRPGRIVPVPVPALLLLWRLLHGILSGLVAGVARQARCPRVLLVGHASLGRLACAACCANAAVHVCDVWIMARGLLVSSECSKRSDDGVPGRWKWQP